MTALARAAPRRGDGMTTVHNNNSRKEKARREPGPKESLRCNTYKFQARFAMAR
jgi:hypothetical protein